MHLLVLTFCVFCLNAQAGYTHYWTWHKMPGDAELKACIDEMARVAGARTNILAGPDGSGFGIIDSKHVDLNGIGDDAHEPFVFPGELGFNFCKTAAKPYDAVVTACLLVARDHFPESKLSIDSDGSWMEGDWREGMKLYSSVLGRTAHDPMSPTGRVLGWPYNLLIPVSGGLLILVAVVVIRKMRWTL